MAASNMNNEAAEGSKPGNRDAKRHIVRSLRGAPGPLRLDARTRAEKMQRVQAVVPVILLSTTVRTFDPSAELALGPKREVTLMHSVSFPRDPHRAEAS